MLSFLRAHVGVGGGVPAFDSCLQKEEGLSEKKKKKKDKKDKSAKKAAKRAQPEDDGSDNEATDLQIKNEHDANAENGSSKKKKKKRKSEGGDASAAAAAAPETPGVDGSGKKKKKKRKSEGGEGKADGEDETAAAVEENGASSSSKKKKKKKRRADDEEGDENGGVEEVKIEAEAVGTPSSVSCPPFPPPKRRTSEGLSFGCCVKLVLMTVLFFCCVPLSSRAHVGTRFGASCVQSD